MASNLRKVSEKEAKGSKKVSNESTSKFPSTPKASADASGSQGTQSKLAERDIRLGRATWNKYVLPMQEFPKVLFKELFQTYPELETLFMHMIDSRNKDIFNSNRFKIHMNSRVMTKLRDIMESLDKPEELTEIMTKLGLYHAKLGVRRKEMEAMKRALVNAVRVAMNKHMQIEEEDALNKCFGYAFNIAIIAGEEYLESQRQIAVQQAQLAQVSSKTLHPNTSKRNLIK